MDASDYSTRRETRPHSAGWSLVVILGIAVVACVLLAVQTEKRRPPDTIISGVVLATDGVTTTCAVGAPGALHDSVCPAAVITVTESSDKSRVAVGSNRTVLDGQPWAVGKPYTGRVPVPRDYVFYALFAVALGLTGILTAGGLITRRHCLSHMASRPVDGPPRT